MKNILKIFSCDLLALKKNVVSVILTVGLVLMPSMFVWYNVLACWDVFGNTGNLKVAVATTDEGYKSDLLPMEVNVGDQVINALRGNDQMNWVFTDEEDAIDGAASGRYYAALVIPKTFSKEMLNFYYSDAERAPIVYYSNQKKSAIAPKVTDQGADRISYQVNKVFVETISDVLLNVMSSVINLSDDENVTSRIDTVIDRIGESSDRISQHVGTLNSYLEITRASQSLINSTTKLIDKTKDSVDEVYDSFEGTSEGATALIAALEQTTESLNNSIASSIQNYDNTRSAIDEAFDASQKTGEDTSKALRDEATNLENQVQETEKLLEALKGLEDHLSDDYKQVLEQYIAVMQNSIDMQKETIKALNEAADNIDSTSSNMEENHRKTQEKVDEAIAALRQVDNSYQNDLKPKLDEVSANISQVASVLAENSKKLDEVSSTLGSGIDNADSKLSEATSAIEEAISKVSLAAENLKNLHNRLIEARDSGGIEKVKEVLGDNPSVFAEALSAPIGVERIAIFPVANFGSAMSPLYAALGLWVGSLLSVVLIKTNPNRRTLEQCERKPHLHEIYLGRFGVFAVMAILQATVMALGNLFFLGIQATDPILYMLCYWVSSLVFMFIMYTFVASFGNVGKAIGVLFLIVQVTGAGGSFPLQLLPDYASIINPFLPATYAIGAMRASMMGIYQGDFWIYLGQLLLFILPMALIGLVLRRPFVKLNEKFVEKVEQSKLI